MNKYIGTIAGIDIRYRIDEGCIFFLAGAEIDNDGSDNRAGDPCWQPDTSLKLLNGKSIDAESVPYIVVPPLIIQSVPGIVLGCQARVQHSGNYRECDAVVADIGPRRKLGEISVECARRIGVPPSPTTGGEVRRIISYEIWPGVPAIVDGVHYMLQPSRS